ncbi:MAG: O-antigen ligase family protein [Bacteroidales bacterium]|nr:O-antigen ligase family protein [Bacteroidales bacterium]
MSEYIKIFSFGSLLLFLFLLPFGLTIANVLLFVFIAGVLLNKKTYLCSFLKKLCGGEKYFLFFSAAYYFWCFLSLCWSDNCERGLQLVGRYILILILPFSFISAKSNDIIKNVRLLNFAFIVGVLISSFVCIYFSYLEYYEEFKDTELLYDFYAIIVSISKGNSFFSYTYISHFIHPSYYSLYFLYTIIVILSELENCTTVKYKVLCVILIIYSLLFIYLLQSRSCFVTLIFISIVFLLRLNNKHKMFIIGLFILGLGSVLLITHSRFRSIIYVNSNNIELNVNQNNRSIIWHNALQVIKDNPILGVGIGDTDTELEKQYQKNNLDFKYGTHNQYIYAQLSMGIVGLILLLAMLLVPFYYGIKNRYFPLIGFSVAVMINLLFENMLTRNAGLMFIPWATMLLLMMSEEKKKEISNE